MPHRLLNELWVGSLSDQQGGKSVPEIMEANPAQSRPVESAVEVAVQDVMGIQGLAVRLAEDEPEIYVVGPVS